MRITKRIVAGIVSIAMVVTTSNLPLVTNTVYAQTENVQVEQSSVTAFATKAELVDNNNFSLWKEDGGVAQNVNFGNGKRWYIAGAQNDQLVLLFDKKSPNKFGNHVFQEYALRYHTYSKDWNCVYENEPTQVNPGHYGASDVRAYLTDENGALKAFTSAEKDLMEDVSIYTRDTKNTLLYSTTDKLYLGYGVFGMNDYIIVGANGGKDASALFSGIKVGIVKDTAPEYSPYADILNGSMWLRSQDGGYFADVVFAELGEGANMKSAGGEGPVVPIMHLNLSSVLFASTANEVSTNAEIDKTMTFRYDGTGKVSSTAVYDKTGIKVKKGANDEYLYVQYKVGKKDVVWSKKITDDMNIYKDCLGIDDFTKCKIWIEKKDIQKDSNGADVDTNLIYAVMAENAKTGIANHTYDSGKITKPATVSATGVKTYTCTVCGDVKTESVAKLATTENDTTENTTTQNTTTENTTTQNTTTENTTTQTSATTADKKTQVITTAKIKSYKAKNLKKKKVTFSLKAKTSGDGKLTYKVTKGKKKYITVSKSGKVTLKKKCKKGTYKITITARETNAYNKATKVVTVKVK